MKPQFEVKHHVPARLAICSHCILSICNIYLFPVLVFKSGICLLIAPVPVHCFSITFCMIKKNVLMQNKYVKISL